MAAQLCVPEGNENASEVFLPPSTAVDWPLTRQQKFQRVLDMFEQELQIKEEELQFREQELCLKDAEIQKLKRHIAESKAPSGAGATQQPGDTTVEACVDLSPYFGQDARGPCTFRGPAEQIAAVLAALVKSKGGAAAAGARRLSRGGDESMFSVLSAEECDSCASTPRAPAAAVAASPVRRPSLRPRLPGLELGGLSQMSFGSQAEVNFAPLRETPQVLGTPRVANTPRNVCLGTPRATPFVATPRSQPRVYALVTPRGCAAPLRPAAAGLSPMKAWPGASPLQRLQETPAEERSSLGSEESASKSDVEEAFSPIATPALEASATAGAASTVRRQSLRPQLPGLELGGLSQMSFGSQAEVSFAPFRETTQVLGTPRVANTPRNVCLGTPRATPFVATPRSQPRVYALVTPRGCAAPLQPAAAGLSPMKARPSALPMQRLQETLAEERSSLGSEESASKSDVEGALSPIATPVLEAQTSQQTLSEQRSSDTEEPAMEPATEPMDAATAEQLGAEACAATEVDSRDGAAKMKTPERIMLEASPTRPRLRMTVASPSPFSSKDQTSKELFAEHLVKLGPQNCAAALRSLSPSKQLAVAEAVKVIAEASVEVSANEALRHDPFASPMRAPSAEKAADTTPAVGEAQMQPELLPWRLATPMKGKEAAAQLAAKAKEGGLTLSRRMAAGFESFSNVGQKATNTITDRWAEECAFRYAQHQLGKR